jgi:phenylalanyl-tRNA synthetase beta chain
VNPAVSTGELAEQLTMAGLEVEAVTPCRPAFSGVVVARVTVVEPHPDAAGLKLCRVDAGTGEIGVVCGADNVQAGGFYALAREGASLPDGRRIGSAELRGVVSEGMLCSAGELGLSDDAGRLLELEPEGKPGQDLAEYLGLDDNMIELSLTPNRGDCLGLAGIAREVAVLNGGQFRRRRPRSVAAAVEDVREIRLEATEACPRYAGRVIRDVDTGRPTPSWIRERLRRSDIRSVNVVVDITNYVMLELGQPMHAFDHDRLQGPVQVRFAREGETVTLLDGSAQTLDAQTLVIADDTGAVAMAGVMGGQDSAVGDDTRDLFLESAWFSPAAILGRARLYGMHTDASHRFERGVDPTLQAEAVERATALILEVCGGRPGPVVDKMVRAQLPAAETVSLRVNEVERQLGIAIPAAACWGILKRLGFQLSGRGTVRDVTAPPYRFDIAREADLIEEIARIHGYQVIPSRLPTAALHMPGDDGGDRARQTMLATLTDRGYYEIITYSFIDPALQQSLLGEGEAAALLNPISAELSVMRRSLWPGLLQALQYNLKRQQQRVRLFELGRVYRGEREPLMLAGLVYGNNYMEQWSIESSYSDFYDLKGDVEALLRAATGPRSDIRFQPARHPALQDGRTAQLLWGEQGIGFVGAVHPKHLRQLDIPNPAYVFELELPLISVNLPIKYEKLSKYPSVRRDLSVLVEVDLPVVELLQVIESSAGDYLHNLQLFDLYRGEGIDLGKKSLTLGLTFQRYSSTLTDEEVDSLMALILNALKEKFGATLRE